MFEFVPTVNCYAISRQWISSRTAQGRRVWPKWYGLEENGRAKILPLQLPMPYGTRVMKCKEATCRCIACPIARCAFGIVFRMRIEFGAIWSNFRMNPP